MSFRLFRVLQAVPSPSAPSLLPWGFKYFITTPRILQAAANFCGSDRLHILYNPWQLAWFCNLLLLCQSGIKPCVPYCWNIICPLILVFIIKMQPTPHHVAHLEPRPATLPGLLAVLPLPPESIRSSATQHFARAEKQTRFLAWLTEPEYRALPKDSFLFAKWVSLRIRWWFSEFLFLLWKQTLFSVLWSGRVWCLLTALRTAATKTVGSTYEQNGCTFPTAAFKKSLLELSVHRALCTQLETVLFQRCCLTKQKSSHLRVVQLFHNRWCCSKKTLPPTGNGPPLSDARYSTAANS